MDSSDLLQDLLDSLDSTDPIRIELQEGDRIADFRCGEVDRVRQQIEGFFKRLNSPDDEWVWVSAEDE